MKHESMGIYDPTKKIYRKPGKFVIRGASDIIGLCDGIFVAIEVKDVGKKKNLTREQVVFLEKICRTGGAAGVADSIEDAKAIIEIARQIRRDYVRLDGTGKEDDRTGPTLC